MTDGAYAAADKPTIYFIGRDDRAVIHHARFPGMGRAR